MAASAEKQNFCCGAFKGGLYDKNTFAFYVLAIGSYALPLSYNGDAVLTVGITQSPYRGWRFKESSILNLEADSTRQLACDIKIAGV